MFGLRLQEALILVLLEMAVVIKVKWAIFSLIQTPNFQLVVLTKVCISKKKKKKKLKQINKSIKL